MARVVLVCLLAAACTPLARESTSVGASQSGPALLGNATQLVVVTTPAWDSTAGELRRFMRAGVRSPWQRVGEVVPVVVGRTGLAWDDLESEGPHKREGDGRSPAGVFPIGTAFGFPPADSMSSLRLPYLQLGAGTDCVDDTASVHYNTVVDRGAVPRVDWNSAEHMRQIGVYRLGVVINYNASPPVKGRGSCIFFHIWSGPRSTTAGCTAMAEPQLRDLVAWLDPRARPVVVQMPASAYERANVGWGLPVL